MWRRVLIEPLGDTREVAPSEVFVGTIRLIDPDAPTLGAFHRATFTIVHLSKHTPMALPIIWYERVVPDVEPLAYPDY